jgi:hypothetical protein
MATQQEEVECIALRDALNKLPGITTVELCPSPWPKGLPIYFHAKSFEALLMFAEVVPTKQWAVTLSASNPKTLTFSLSPLLDASTTALTERIENYVEVKK